MKIAVSYLTTEEALWMAQVVNEILVAAGHSMAGHSKPIAVLD
ncbi:MAG: hypothetical protein RBJ76_04765 [Stenomitos frigidus ULC029]